MVVCEWMTMGDARGASPSKRDSVWPRSGLGSERGCAMLLMWVTVLLGCGLRSFRNRYECVRIESVHVELV